MNDDKIDRDDETADEGDVDDEVMGEFLEELTATDDVRELVRRFTAKYPQWGPEFAEEASMHRVLQSSREQESNEAFPDLDQLADFRIVRWIASGGMGIVFEAEQISLGRRVALKIRHGRTSPELQARFLREQHALARLHQSHIVPIHVAGEFGGWQYFAMAHIDGASLHRVVRAALEHLRAGAGSLPTLPELVRHARDQRETFAAADPDRPLTLPSAYFRSIAATVADAAEALEFAHAANVVHRDIKPSNLLIDETGHCWIIDFGLAQNIGTSPSGETITAPLGAAMTLGPLGTPEYMAPEQHEHAYDGTPADPRSDVWCLGATLYELLTLRRPFQGATYEEVKRQVLHDEPAPPRSLVRNVPIDLVEIVRRAMRKKLADRYATANELAADLRRWLRGEPTGARPAHLPRLLWMWARRNPGWSLALAATFLAIAGGIVSMLLYEHSETRQAELRAAAAEERQREQFHKTQLQQRESLMIKIQRLQLSRLSAGWSKNEWELIEQACDIQRDDRLRELAAATLRGLDVTLKKRFPFAGSSVAFDAAGQRLLIGGHQDTRTSRPALLWSVNDQSETTSRLPGKGPVAFDAADRPLQLVHDREHRTMVLWDLANNRRVRAFPFTDSADRQRPLLAMSAMATHVAASLGDQTIIWNATNGAVEAQLAHRSDAIAFSSEGDLVALADSGRARVIVWSLSQNKTVFEKNTGHLPTTSLAFGRSARRRDSAVPTRRTDCLASGDSGGRITIWDLEKGHPTAFCQGSPREILTLAFSPDGTLLASAGREEAQLWDVASGQPRMTILDPHGMDYMNGLAFSRDGRRLAISSEGQGASFAPSVTVWELASQRGMQRLSGLSGQIDTVVISPDGRRVAALAQNWEVGLWDLDTGQLRAVFETPSGSYADNAGLAFSPDARFLAFAASSMSTGEARLWDADTGAELRRWKLPPGLQNKLAFDGPERLWHFQVELHSGKSLPDSELTPWKEHPRVCRIRDLKAVDPVKPVSELTEFNRGVYIAVAPQDGKYFAIEGKGGVQGDQRWIKIVEAPTGRITWSRALPRRSQAAHLVLDPSGTTMRYMLNDDPPSLRVSVPDGRPCGEWAFLPWATTDSGLYHCLTHMANKSGCYLFRDDDARPVVTLSQSAGILGAAFNRSGDRLAWGERDGSVLVADLLEIRRRLSTLGLEW